MSQADIVATYEECVTTNAAILASQVLSFQRDIALPLLDIASLDDEHKTLVRAINKGALRGLRIRVEGLLPTLRTAIIAPDFGGQQ